jgi:MoaA/NifB/PqqE/SkfB family radical SAM enzyme
MGLPETNQGVPGGRDLQRMVASAGRLLRSQLSRSPLVAKALRAVTERSQAGQDLPPRACHLYRLAVDSNGDVYPCCIVYRSPYHKIGSLGDPDLAEAIEQYDRTCSCDVRLRKKNAQDPTGEERCLNLELSLVCQAECAMCCVGAPDWKGKYDRYAELTQLVRSQKPDSIVVQGGEVLIQPRSLDWLRQIKREFPQTRLQVVTNGNLDVAMVPALAGLFDAYVISFVGFQPATYRAIMGLDIDKTLAFTRALIEQRQSEVTLKFLITALTLHEIAPFLAAAVELRPNKLLVAESNVASYVVTNTPDRFWRKIVARSAAAVRRALCSSKQTLDRHDMKVCFESAAARLLDLDARFLEENGLGARVFLQY